MNNYRINNNSILLIMCLFISSTSLKSQSPVLAINLSGNTQIINNSQAIQTIRTPASDSAYYINNAGLVLLYPYLKTLFEKAGYTTENKFLNTTAQTGAIYLLDYAAFGGAKSSEHLLVLNKLLCGLDIVQPITNNKQLSEQHKYLVESMLQGLINNWSIIGETTIDGLRESFIDREGSLIEQEDKWLLTIKTMSIDVLVDKLPYNFSTINLPWMKKPLQVNWR